MKWVEPILNLGSSHDKWWEVTRTAFRKTMSKISECVPDAPIQEPSRKSHCITLIQPLKLLASPLHLRDSFLPFYSCLTYISRRSCAYYGLAAWLTTSFTLNGAFCRRIQLFCSSQPANVSPSATSKSNVHSRCVRISRISRRAR